jgi:EmrB/QacA subfamily drug resistance transporter
VTQSTTVSNSRQVALLAALFLGTFIALLDVSIVTVTLPSLQTDLHASLADLQWVVDGYLVAQAAVMLTGGALADRFGRKRVFLTGLTVFTLASLACGLAPGVSWLVAARVVQGGAASVVIPGAMSLIAQSFPEPDQRARVLGWWTSVAGLAFVLGPLVGGPLTEILGWQSVFFINLPLGAVAVVFGWHALTESADPEHAALDPLGQLLATVWIGALAYAVIDAGHTGWARPQVTVTLAVAAVAFAGFVAAELRHPHPMLPIRLFGRREFGVVNLASFTVGFGTLATFFLLSLYLQNVRGATPTEAGLQFLPYVLANSGMSLLTSRMVARHGPRRPLLAGYALLALVPLAMLTLTPTTPYVVIAVLFTVAGCGLSLAGIPINAMALHAVPRERSGIASATVNATRQTGTALGVATLGVLAASGTDFVDGLHHALLAAGLGTAAVAAAVAISLRPAGDR